MKTSDEGKGRPTPKRREAEGRRRGPAAPPPRTQREAYRRARGNKEERRKAGRERRERMMAGDERYLLPRDRGPVRAHVRDLVDSRRTVLGLFMPLALVVLVALFIPLPQVQQSITLALFFIMLVMGMEGVLLGRSAIKAVRKKFPDAPDKSFSLSWYAFSRATQLRKLRVPRPRTVRK